MTPNRYATSYPALNNDVVTQGHSDYCADTGHASHTVGGVLSTFCPRCGESRTHDHHDTPGNRVGLTPTRVGHRL